MTDEFDGLLEGSDQPVSQLISDMRIEADQSHFEELTEPAVELGSQGQRNVRWRPRVAAAIAATIALLAGFSGAAWAAQGAEPGDTLYGLDRALESFGIGNGGAAERLDEAKALVEQNQLNRGLEHAADAFSDHPGAQSALSAAAVRAAELDVASVPAEVALLLDYLSANVGSIDDGTVADLAQTIGPEAPAGTPPVDTPPAGTPPVDTPPVDTPPVDTPPAGTPPVDTPPVDTPPVDTPPAATPPVDTPPVDTPPAATPPVDTPPVDTPPVDAPPVDTPQP